MASIYNMKGAHKDGKAEFKIGIDENSKIIDGIGNEIKITNQDGSPAKISKENIPFLPDDVSESNKLVTEKDLKDMMTKINNALKSQAESMTALLELARIVGAYDNEKGE